MKYKKIGKETFHDLIDKAIASAQQIIGVVEKGTRFAFSELKSSSELALDYDVTILPPKKYFIPPVESVLSYKVKDASSYQAVVDEYKRVIIGIHPYDLTGIKVLDAAFMEDKKDPNYIARRTNTTLIGFYPTREFKYRFASSADNLDPSETSDAMLCDLGDCYGVEIFTDKGNEFFDGSIEEDDAVAEEIEKNKNSVPDGQKLPIPASDVPAFLEERSESKVWEEKAAKCYSCGSCVLVCPTCYCFNMKEELDLSLEKGERVRTWDGCMLEGFAEVAGGHNFRDQKAARFRHRIFRKGKYLVERLGRFGCVGCGRCADACTTDVANPVEVLEDLNKES